MPLAILLGAREFGSDPALTLCIVAATLGALALAAAMVWSIHDVAPAKIEIRSRQNRSIDALLFAASFLPPLALQQYRLGR
jgi:hypothetical protein